MRTRKAALLGAEPSLRSLLEDVLQEVGVELLPPGELGGADLVLAHLGAGDRATREVLAALRRAPAPPPLVLLLPFSDDGLRAQASRLGAQDCFALGTPLSLLRACVLGALSSLPGAR